MWLHIPAAIYGALISIIGWICPLTPLENRFRRLAGQEGYEGGFIENYLVPTIYPPGLTPTMQLMLAVLLVVIAAIAYGGLFYRLRRSR